MAETIIKTFQYKIKHTSRFSARAFCVLESSREVYNAALEERIIRYRQGKPISLHEQARELTEARELGWVRLIPRKVHEDALERLDYAYQSFFGRLKNGDSPGFPRFKNRDRYRTFSQRIDPRHRCPLNGNVLTIPGIGRVRVRLSRPIEGRVKQLRITKRPNGWYALLVCELLKPEHLHANAQSVGIDLGLTHFATLSNGEKIDNPRHLRRAAKALKRSQQALSRKKKGSANRVKARERLAKRHLKVSNARKDFHHKTALDIVCRFDSIKTEDLKILNMAKNHRLAKSIGDAGWGQFMSILASKAENAGREFVKVPAAYTSQTCSRCGIQQKMLLKQRTYKCSLCELTLDRDHNAAINIGRGTAKSTRLRRAMRLVEAGTDAIV